MAAADEMYRVSIRAGDREVDVSLPAHLPLRDLLPAVADLVGDHALDGGLRCLRRASGELLDPVKSLAQSDTHDGESLFLTTAVPALAPVYADTCAEVAAAIADVTHLWGRREARIAGWVAVCWAASMSAVLLIWPAVDGHAGRAAVSAAVSALALSGAVVAQRHDRDSGAAVALGLLAAVFAGATGLFSAPGHFGLPGVFLAMSAAAAMALLVWRLLGSADWAFLPLAAAGVAGSVVSVGAVAGWWPFSAAGPVLVVCSLTVLIVAPRLVVRGGGLAGAAAADAGRTAAPAVLAHRRLTVLVAAAAAATAVGVVFTAAGTSRPVPAATMVALAGVLSLLRARSHRESYHVVALVFSSAVAASTLVLMVAAAAASATPWLCAGLAVVAASAMRAGRREPRRWPPAALHAAAVLDLAAIVALTPVAAVAAGVLL